MKSSDRDGSKVRARSARIESVPRQKTPSSQATNASDSAQRLVVPEQLAEQGKHPRPVWHWFNAVQAPHSPTTLVLHLTAGTSAQVAKCWSTLPSAPKSRSNPALPV
jgi:hypothetical protein